LQEATQLARNTQGCLLLHLQLLQVYCCDPALPAQLHLLLHHQYRYQKQQQRRVS
jgi:hypothetical protein